MLTAFRLNRIIKKSVKQTVSALDGKSPEIFFHDYYGAVEISTKNLTIWYVFKTDSDLSEARESGFCDEIVKLTVANLISSGYPKDAFVTDKNGRRASVCFASQEDVDRKADGDYRLYFQ